MAQRTTSDRSYHAGVRKLNAESVRLLAEAKMAGYIAEAEQGFVWMQAPTLNAAEVEAIEDSMMDALIISDMIERPEVVAAVGVANANYAGLFVDGMGFLIWS